MFADKSVRGTLSCIVAGGVASAFGSVAALAAPAPPLDQDKLLPDFVIGKWILYYTDAEPDGAHDPGEPYFDAPGGNDWNEDRSCWMASAANMLEHEGSGNSYLVWLKHGGARAGDVSPWGGVLSTPGGGAFKTFDDGGWQHWAIKFAGRQVQGPIITNPEHFGGTWAQDPIAWCQRKLAADHAVGLTLHWGYDTALREECPDAPETALRAAGCGYHAITLWEIDETAKTVTITDSDDDAEGPATFNYTYSGSRWVLTDYIPNTDAYINYAVSFPEKTSAVSGWGMGVVSLLLLTGIAIKFGRRRATPVAA